MRVVGITLVLTALAAIQLPWFTCHSDCQDACLPVWELGAHHCHDEAAHRPSDRSRARHTCPCCPASSDAPSAASSPSRTSSPAPTGDDADPSPEDGDGHDHEPGTHELLVQSSRRPVSSTIDGQDLHATFVALATAPVAAAAPPAVAPPVHLKSGTGPPDGLASVRLLL